MSAPQLPDTSLGRHPLEDRALRVLFMADHLGHPSGRVHGGTTYFLNTIPALAEAGFEIDPVFLGPRHPMADRLEARGITARFLDQGKFDLRALSAARTMVLAGQYDVLHLHSFKSHLAGQVAVRGQSAAAIVHVHDQIKMPAPLRFFQKRLGPATAALIGVSESVTAFGQQEYNVPSERCRTIPNGLDLAPFRAAKERAERTLRKELDVPAERRVLLVAGRLNPVKGHPQLFEAMKTVTAADPDCELWVVGDGEARGDYERMVKDFGLGDRVRFLGQREDMPEVFASADIVLVPSMWEEGFGLVALEAAATGRPVVAFDVGGLSALVHHQHSGLLVPRGDTTALADAILSLLRDDALRTRLEAGTGKVAESFTLDRHIANLAETYRDAVRQERAA